MTLVEAGMALVIGVMFAAGVFQLLQRDGVRAIVGLVLLTNAVNLLLLAAGHVQGVAPAYTDAPEPRSDSLPQALVLTAIVISMGAFVVVLALLSVLQRRYRTTDTDAVRGLRH
ncbi:MAG: NADH-quinone oxidoreductase subunit K [Verrucomicrobiae bacterium]|nr:NADH-quinone oxidoreductase subunit K [Verrucomicrobiae bacterium]